MLRLKNITDECLTINMNGRSMIFWKGIVLCESVYSEQPYEIDNMDVSLEENDSGEVVVLVKTPLSEEHFDYHEAVCFSGLDELLRFEKSPFDPLNRGFYPLQSKLENGSLVEIGEHFGNGCNRLYLDTNIMAAFNINYFAEKGRFPMEDEIEQAINEVYILKALFKLNTSGSWIKKDKVICFNVLSIPCQMRVVADPFGEFFVIEYERVNFEAKLRLTKRQDVKSKDVIVAINDIPFDHLIHKGGTYLSQYGIEVGEGLVMDAPVKEIIERIISSKCSEEAVGKLINLNRYVRSLPLAVNQKVITSECVELSGIIGFGTLDYETYLAS